MKAKISDITVGNRIRKDGGDIGAFAEDIRVNGLINPVSVMRAGGGELKLLAGFRRLKAAKLLGWEEIEINMLSPADSEAELLVEISENEQRKPFTVSEIAHYGKLLEEIEAVKVTERRAEGNALGGMTAGRGRPKDNSLADPGPSSYGAGSNGKRETREVIGEKIGMSGRQYDRVKYIAANAPPEMLDQVDRGELKIRRAYDELRAKEKDAATPVVHAETESAAASPLPVEASPDPAAFGPAPIARKQKTQEEFESNKQSPVQARAPKPSPGDYLSAKDREAIRRLREFDALPFEGKVAELQRQLREERARAAAAESGLAALQERHQNDAYHKDANIENLKGQINALETALAAAQARVKELEEKYEPYRNQQI
ncbi:MAG: ParB N-terminal domain-containing protein [Oscillospiraceae bacterium]|nr:ParB N-terminal domain-containing protein [Oscillospiraceae bacterium]